ncbi:hypothetical protein TWF102_003724 [Orbilia oligospora]|uniref:F-box domain-containing protein n=1 Tax=Orbilia oligospora TaxID=2813651 RepID=A0A7C8NIL1_ORBOL|nr:hypothetical protein TWF102_003724 [Orbilia oligospora]KAF3106166.1 hypothetical protein TWF706_003546 [Orbilia oligospora]
MFSGCYDIGTAGDKKDSDGQLPDIHKIERTRYIPSTAAAKLGRKKPKRSRLVQSSKLTATKFDFNPQLLATEEPVTPKPDETTPDPKPKSGMTLPLLPLEIHEKILEYLPYEEHFTLAQVCDVWMELLQTDKFAVKRYRSLRVAKTAVLRHWFEPTLSERYQRATTNFLLYNQKLFLEMYRGEDCTATLIISSKPDDKRVLSREERVLKKRRDQVVNICQILPTNHQYVEIHKLALFERDTIFFVGQHPSLKAHSRGGQRIYFSTVYLNAHTYRDIINPPDVAYITVPDVFCSAETTLKVLMEGINKHITKHDEEGCYTAQLKDPSAAESFNFGFSGSQVSFRARSITTKKAMSEISGQGLSKDSGGEEPFKAVLGDMDNLFISEKSLLSP